MGVGYQLGDASGGLKEHLTEQLKMAVEKEPGQSIKAPQHFLGAPSLPTITSKLAGPWNLWRWGIPVHK